MNLSRKEAIRLGRSITTQLMEVPAKDEIYVSTEVMEPACIGNKSKEPTSTPSSPLPEDVLEPAKNSYSALVEDTPVKPYKSYQSGNYVEPGEGPIAEGVVHDYTQGVPLHVIEGRYNISAGQIYSHLNSAGVPMRQKQGSKLQKKLAHLTLDDYDKIAKDYTENVFSLEYLYKKYKIHKNGLYYILDSMDIDRRQKK